MNEHGQADKGGERGMNSEWYEGGQFMPSSIDTVKGAYKPVIRKGTKKEVAPYTWEAAPADDMLSIYDRIAHFCSDNRRECQFVKGHGFVGFKVTAEQNMYGHYGKAVMCKPTRENGWNDTVTLFYPDAALFEWIRVLAEKFNNGERWYPLADDPFHFKNR